MKKNKKLPKGCLWVIIALGAVFIYFIIASKIEQEKTADQLKGPWTSLTYEQKQAWITNYLKNPDDNAYSIIGQMNKELKEKFSHPDEVEFTTGQRPTFLNADIVDADRGVTFVRGSGTAKNSFGVKSGFVYSIRLIVTKDSLYIDDISVSEKR